MSDKGDGRRIRQKRIIGADYGPCSDVLLPRALHRVSSPAPCVSAHLGPALAGLSATGMYLTLFSKAQSVCSGARDHPGCFLMQRISSGAVRLNPCRQITLKREVVKLQWPKRMVTRKSRVTYMGPCEIFGVLSKPSWRARGANPRATASSAPLTGSPTAAIRTWPSFRSGSGAAGRAHPSPRRWSLCAGAWCCRSTCARTPRHIP